MQIRTLSNNVVLRPVVELSPEDLGHSEASFLKGLSGSAHWLSCLETAGIAANREVAADSWLVYTDDIVASAALRVVVKAHLASPDGRGAMLPLADSALQGGFVLVDGAEAVLVPDCCGHLGQLKEWRRAADYRSFDPLKLRLGHPELSVSFENGMLYLHEKQDDDQRRAVRVTPEALSAAVDGATVKVAELMTRLRTAMRNPRKASAVNGAAVASR